MGRIASTLRSRIQQAKQHINPKQHELPPSYYKEREAYNEALYRERIRIASEEGKRDARKKDKKHNPIHSFMKVADGLSRTAEELYPEFTKPRKGKKKQADWF